MTKTDSSGHTGNRDEFKQVLHRAAALCSRKELSSGQIRAKLKEWKVDEPWTEKILNHLIEQKFVDDRRYASLFAREKFRLNRWGRVKIAHHLRQHGIGEEIIEDALKEIDEDTYYRICKDLIKGKSASIKDKNAFTRKGKILRYLSGKGFETDLIYRILNSEEMG
jgi:regulatory protein